MNIRPFDPADDFAPVSFSTRVCLAAKKMKQNGLIWTPQVGCFVWDENKTINAPSPFPGNIYFVLNLKHFHRFYSDPEEMTIQLVWLPTWYQCQQIVRRYGLKADPAVFAKYSDPDDIYLAWYRFIAENI